MVDAFRFVVENEAVVGSYTYLLKTDSDSLVCVSRLMRWLRQDTLPLTGVYAGDPQTYYGRLDYGLGHKFDDHNYVTIFNQTNYSRYNLGGGKRFRRGAPVAMVGYSVAKRVSTIDPGYPEGPRVVTLTAFDPWLLLLF